MALDLEAPKVRRVGDLLESLKIPGNRKEFDCKNKESDTISGESWLKLRHPKINAYNGVLYLRFVDVQRTIFADAAY